MKTTFKGLVIILILAIMTVIPSTGVIKAKTSKTTDMQTTTIGKKTYYIVKTEKQLRSIGKGKYAMSDNYMLDADISLKKEWVAIGDDEKPFTGTFNGNGFIISDLKITDKKAKYIGLFGYVEGGTIYNVTLKNVDIDSAGGKGRRIAPIVVWCIDGELYDNQVIK